MALGMDLVEAWDTFPSYQKRALIKSVVVTGVGLAAVVYESRKVGWKEAARPRFIWNIPKDRQKIYYMNLLVQLMANQIVNKLNEDELKKLQASAKAGAMKQPPKSMTVAEALGL